MIFTPRVTVTSQADEGTICEQLSGADPSDHSGAQAPMSDQYQALVQAGIASLIGHTFRFLSRANV